MSAPGYSISCQGGTYKENLTLKGHTQDILPITLCILHKIIFLSSWSLLFKWASITKKLFHYFDFNKMEKNNTLISRRCNHFYVSYAISWQWNNILETGIHDEQNHFCWHIKRNHDRSSFCIELWRVKSSCLYC